MIILKHQLQCALNPLAWLTSSTSSTFVGHCFHTYQPCSLQAVCFLLVHTAGLVCLSRSKYILLQPSLLCKLMQMQDVHRVCALLVIITLHMCTRGKKIGLCVCCPCCHHESCQVRQLSDSYRPTDTSELVKTGISMFQIVQHSPRASETASFSWPSQPYQEGHTHRPCPLLAIHMCTTGLVEIINNYMHCRYQVSVLRQGVYGVCALYSSSQFGVFTQYQLFPAC